MRMGWYSPRVRKSIRNSAQQRPIRVMHVVDLLALAGMEYGVIKLVNRLDPERIRSMIACMRHQTNDVRQLLASTIPVHELRKSPGRNWRVIGRLAALFRRERVDIVHSHNWPTFLYSVAAARLAGVAIMVHGEHGKDETIPHRGRLLVSRVLARGVAQVCTVSRDLTEELIRDWHIPPERVTRIPNGVDLEAFGTRFPIDGLRGELNLTSENRVVMTTGGFRPIKDLPTLLRAFARVHRDDPMARLLLVGKGTSTQPYAGLDRLASDLGVADAVRFAGVRQDIPKLLQLCDVYVNSSLFEGMSNTILESMAAGRPVVATAVGGNPEIVQDGVTGYLVPPGQEEPMAALMGRLLSDPSLRGRMGAAGRARIEAEHSMTGMIRAYSDLYEELWMARGGRHLRASGHATIPERGSSEQIL
jgi:sugar transferase (PEP-CTERM/EpsH1 system associated)